MDKILSFFQESKENRITSFLCETDSKRNLLLSLNALLSILQQSAIQEKRVLLVIDSIADLFHNLYNFYHYSGNDVDLIGTFKIYQRHIHTDE